MDVTTDQDITGQLAKKLRLDRGLSQPKFWGAIGVKQSVASKYESGQRRLPSPIRSMLFIRYVAGITLDPSTTDGAAALRKLAGNIPQSHEDTPT